MKKFNISTIGFFILVCLLQSPASAMAQESATRMFIPPIEPEQIRPYVKQLAETLPDGLEARDFDLTGSSLAVKFVKDSKELKLTVLPPIAKNALCNDKLCIRIDSTSETIDIDSLEESLKRKSLEVPLPWKWKTEISRQDGKDNVKSLQEMQAGGVFESTFLWIFSTLSLILLGLTAALLIFARNMKNSGAPLSEAYHYATGKMALFCMSIGLPLAVLALAELSVSLGLFNDLNYSMRKTADHLLLARLQVFEESPEMLALDWHDNLKPDLDFVSKPDRHLSPMDTPDRPYRIRTNSRGFRDDEFTSKTGGTFRILALGDSCTFGMGVAPHDRTTEILERKLLQAFPETKIEILNAGLGGCSLVCANDIFESLNDLQPDLILLQFSVNDVHVAETQDLLLESDLWTKSRLALMKFTYSSALLRLIRSRFYPDFKNVETPNMTAFSRLPEVARRERQNRRAVMEKIIEKAATSKAGIIAYTYPTADGNRLEFLKDGLLKSSEPVEYISIPLPPRTSEVDIPQSSWLARLSKIAEIDKEHARILFPFWNYYVDMIHPAENMHVWTAEHLIQPLSKHIAAGTKKDPQKAGLLNNQ